MIQCRMRPMNKIGFALLVLVIWSARLRGAADLPGGAATPAISQPAASELTKNLPVMVEADGHLRLHFGPEQLVLPRGLQPSMLCTASGALVVQAQVPDKPFPSNRMTYPWAD